MKDFFEWSGPEDFVAEQQEIAAELRAKREEVVLDLAHVLGHAAVDLASRLNEKGVEPTARLDRLADPGLTMVPWKRLRPRNLRNHKRLKLKDKHYYTFADGGWIVSSTGAVPMPKSLTPPRKKDDKTPVPKADDKHIFLATDGNLYMSRPVVGYKYDVAEDRDESLGALHMDEFPIHPFFAQENGYAYTYARMNEAIAMGALQQATAENRVYTNLERLENDMRANGRILLGLDKPTNSGPQQ